MSEGVPAFAIIAIVVIPIAMLYMIYGIAKIGLVEIKLIILKIRYRLKKGQWYKSKSN